MSNTKSKMSHSSHSDGKSKSEEKDKSGMDPDFSGQSDEAEDTFQNLSDSDYSKVIFCDLYYNNDSTVGCRFQITDRVSEDPFDYIGLFRVGFVNLTQCLAAKLLAKCDCEEDGKLIRCTFRPRELPVLENGFYQFLYVTREREICGASMPFQIDSSISKALAEDDIVADCSEDDFLVVRSNIAEKNRRLQALLDELTEKCLNHEGAMKKVQQELKIVCEEKIQLQHSLKQACAEKLTLINESQRIAEEKDIVCSEKEEAIRILKEKNKVFSSMFDNYSEKLREFTDLKDALEADKNLALTENAKLHERIEQLNKDLQNEKKLVEIEKEKNKDLIIDMKKDTISLTSQLDDAHLMIEVLEKSKRLSMEELGSLNEEVAKLKGKLKDIKCENLVLKTRLAESQAALEKAKDEKQNLLSEMTALKLHIIENHPPQSSIRGPIPDTREMKDQSRLLEVKESEVQQASSSSDDEKSKAQQASLTPEVMKREIQQASSSEVKERENSLSKLQEENIQTDETKEDIEKMKSHCEELHREIERKNGIILKLQDELMKTHGVVEYLSKERDSAQKNESSKQQALDECISRLNEAAVLYKKQFRKIEKLKKKLSKSSSDFMETSSSASMSVKDAGSTTESTDEAPSTVELPQAQNSDSDTGEHVLRRPSKEARADAMKCLTAAVKKVFPLSYAPGDIQPSCSKNREVPELQSLIEMNLEKFKNSKSKAEDEIYGIPCPVCDQDVGVFMSSADEMIKHLEMQHKQQVCPVCGRLFDMTLPPKYFTFHVEDHFKEDKK